LQWLIDIIKEIIHGQLGYFHRGDPGSADFTLGDLTVDNDWHDLDLSAIVPANAQAINLKVNIRANVISNRFAIRRKDVSNEWNTLVVWTQVANVRKGVLEPVACDADRVVGMS
jgi:hypothetical protein